MTVKELIRKFERFDPNIRALTPGFDGSHCDDMGERQ
jgi:hypothetical protein